MTADEWEVIKRIFDSASKLPPVGRDRYLDSACNGNTGLRATIEELLSANDAASGFLNDEPASPDSLPPVFQPGDIVARRFRIIRLIARGGMGEVYETFDETLRARIALKTLRPELASDGDALQRFKREILVTRDVGHENLCRVFELIEHRLPPLVPGDPEREVICLTMQLMSGENLQQHIATNGKMSPAEALPLIRQIAGAIDALHRNNIIHRDLKPSNVMITSGRNGALRAIVMDFGLARPLGPGKEEAFKSRTDLNAGAPYFLAPELFGHEKPSIASDIYAFGLIIDEMVTGGGAFPGDSVQQIFSQKLFGEPIDPRKRNPDLPSTWAAAILHCLQRDPAKRFQTALAVVDQLDDGKGLTKPLPTWLKPLFATRLCIRFTHFVAAHRRKFLAVIGFALFGILATAWLFQPLNTSVVTFQFENLTGLPENDDLCKGLTREMERRLQLLDGVVVIPYHAPRPKDSRLKLDARFSIDGYVQKSGSNIQVSVEVVDNASGKLLPSPKFTNGNGDILRLQSDIAEDVANAMRDDVLVPAIKSSRGPLPSLALILIHRLGWIPKVESAKSPTNNSAAMRLYMRAHELWEQRKLHPAIELYKQAIHEDPNFALAYADLAGVECTLLQYNDQSRSRLFESAREHAKMAVQKGPDYPETYAALAVVNQLSWNWPAAERYFKRALQLNPKLADVHRNYGGFLVQFGRFDEGIKETHTSIGLDPFEMFDRCFLGAYLYDAGRYTEAVNTLEHYLAEKDFKEGRQLLALNYIQLALQAEDAQRANLLQKALKETMTIAKLESAEASSGPYTGLASPLYSLIYAYQGDRPRAMTYLNLLLAGDKLGAVDPMDIIAAYTALGDTKAALTALQKAVDAKDPDAIDFNVEPLLANLHSFPQYRALVKQAALDTTTN